MTSRLVCLYLIDPKLLFLLPFFSFSSQLSTYLHSWGYFSEVLKFFLLLDFIIVIIIIKATVSSLCLFSVLFLRFFSSVCEKRRAVIHSRFCGLSKCCEKQVRFPDILIYIYLYIYLFIVIFC